MELNSGLLAVLILSWLAGTEPDGPMFTLAKFEGVVTRNRM